VSLSSPFVMRPIATTLLAVGVSLSGAIAYFQLPVAPLPRVEYPTLLVTAQLPGASPETMAAAMAAPLERRFGRIAGLTDMTSSSSLGSTSITMQFDLDRSVDAAGRDVQAAIAAAAADLPSDLPTRPTQRRIDPSDTPIMIAALRSDALSIPRLYAYADEVLSPRIGSLEGVGQVVVGGGAQPAIRIEVSPAALQERGIGLDQVRAAVAGSTQLRPAGRISGHGMQLEIAPSSQLFGTDAFSNLIVSMSAAGAPVRLSDVATVGDGVVNDRAAAWADGERAVLLIIRREPGANVIETTDRVRALLPELRALIPPAIRLDEIIDRSATIRAAVSEVLRSLILSVVLVVVVVFVFLRSPRATVIPSVAVPLSLLGTFAAMYLLDFSLNVLSLMALTVSTGFVVDDAIVVTENVVRLMERGQSPLRAALEGAKQIGFTIISITVSLLAVFLPILLMGGLVGRLFREMALTLGAAITISAFVSLTVTPMMCSRILRADMVENEGRVSRWFGRQFERMAAAYGRGLDYVLVRRKRTLGMLVLAVGLTGALAYTIPTGLFPTQDTGIMFGTTAAPDDVSFAALVERQQRVSAIIRRDPAVQHVVAFVGAGPGGGATSTATLFSSLRPMSERHVPAGVVATRITRQFDADPEVQVFFSPAQDLRVGARPSRSAFQYTLQGEDIGELRVWAARLMAELRREPSLRQVSTDQTDGGLALRIEIDRDMASRLGITPRDVDTALSSAFGQRQIATTFTEASQVRVVLEVAAADRDGPDDLDVVRVRSSNGALVPLRAFTRVVRERTPLAVNHQGQIPAVTLTFDLAPGAALGDAVRIVNAAQERIGMPASVHAGFAGTAQTYQSSMATQLWLILAAIVVVYLVLGMLYESLIHPLTILSTLPPAAVGALVALWAFGLQLNVVAMIGIILLIGIVAKNAIMMIDFALEKQRDEGKPAAEAIREAAVLRFRPILMTTLAAIGGALPLALGTGIGSELRMPLGVTIASGLAASQMLTLFTTPVVFVTLDRFAKTTRSPLVKTAPLTEVVS